jgi:hypothetical protein
MLSSDRISPVIDQAKFRQYIKPEPVDLRNSFLM